MLDSKDKKKSISKLNQKKKSKIKVVLTWVPHSQSLPQAVANSFAEWVSKLDVEFVIANPPGFNLSKKYTKNALVTHNQNEALSKGPFEICVVTFAK